MKLTQPSGRTSVPSQELDPSPLVLRLEQMEQRLREIENTPRTLAAVEKAGVPAQAFDQKVLEAVVNALDARLRENTSHVERQITELQAKITIELKTLHMQDRSIADGLQAVVEDGRKQAAEQTAHAIREMEEQVHARLEAIRQASEADRQSMRDFLATVREEVGGQFAVQLEGVREEIRGEMRETSAKSAALRQHMALQVDEQLAGLRQELRADLQESTGKIADLRHDMAAQFDETLLGVRQDLRGELQDTTAKVADLHEEMASRFDEQLAAVRQEIRAEMQEASARMVSMAASAADSASENRLAPMRAALDARDKEIAELRSRLVNSDQATLDLLQGVGEICRRAAQHIHGPALSAPDPSPSTTAEPPLPPAAAGSSEPPAESDNPVPGFVEAKPAGKLWRVPLVSSLIITSGAMAMLHYL